MMFGVEGTLIFFLFSIVLVAIYLSHPYPPTFLISHIFLPFPSLPFFPYISTWLCCVKKKKKKGNL